MDKRRPRVKFPKIPGSDYYILDRDHRPVPTDMMTWARAFEDTAGRVVAKNTVAAGVEVSTVFLGLDHRFFGDGPPLLFESLVFGGPLADEMVRYSSWDDAVTGHEALVRRCTDAVKNFNKAPVRDLDL